MALVAVVLLVGARAAAQSPIVVPFSAPMPAGTMAQVGPPLSLAQAMPAGDPFLGSAACPVPPYNGFQPQTVSLFGDYLFLTAGGVDVNYAAPVGFAGPALVPVGSDETIRSEYHSGFRIGGAVALDPYSALTATYWNFGGQDDHSSARAGGGTVFRPLTADPATFDARFPALSAAADYNIRFQMVDAAYRSVLWHNPVRVFHYVIGARFAHLDQEFAAAYRPFGPSAVNSNIRFNGVGPRVGIEGERLFGLGFFYYGEGFANLLVGNFDSHFTQRNLAGAVQTASGFRDHRIVPILEGELGLGWQSPTGWFRVRGGYYISGWFNSVTTPAFLQAVQGHNFGGVNDTITFSGLAARAEIRF